MVRINPKAERLYNVICAWCRRVVGYSEVEHSHGICPDCAKKLLEDR
jgi:hypothetical protein